MARYEADVVIIGGGITAAMVAEKLAELRPNLSIIVVEAGKRLFDFENRFEYRQRNLDYGENQWPGDFVADQSARGVISEGGMSAGRLSSMAGSSGRAGKGRAGPKAGAASRAAENAVAAIRFSQCAR